MENVEREKEREGGEIEREWRVVWGGVGWGGDIDGGKMGFSMHLLGS